ncbi:MAG: AF1514 family protein [Chromatiales bacterium]|nr:AF1514 family protein [Chromatiales bacterium]
MKQINISIDGMDLDYKSANAIARSLAAMFEREPTVVAWHDAVHSKMSPVIEGADVNTRWRDYGEAYGGKVSIDINGEYDFIFADTAEFVSLEKGPYISLHDKQGHEYLCLADKLKDPNNPNEDACYRIDEVTFSALHEG